MGDMILNSREKRRLFSQLADQWGMEIPKEIHEALWMETEDGRIYYSSREAGALIDLRVQRYGIYLAKRHDNLLRLSVEGSQLLGPFASKKVVYLNTLEAELWLKGTNLEKSLPDFERGSFVLLCREGDFMGCGRYGDACIYSFVPKERRLAPNAESF